MFGSKLKIWMETHIVRTRRKSQPDKDKIANHQDHFLESSESLAQSDTGVSSGSQQVLSSSTNGLTDSQDGYCTTTMESNRRSLSHTHTAVNLSSPESAYSTGYSTDGASPGGTGPPEYYINIRTGKHYFPSPAPTPTSPVAASGFNTIQQILPPTHSITTSFLSNQSSMPTYPSQYSVTSSLLSPHSSDLTTSSSCLPKSSSQFSSSSFTNRISPCDKIKNKGILSYEEKKSNFQIFSCTKSPNKKEIKKSQPKSPLSTFKLLSALKSPSKRNSSPDCKVDKKPKPISPIIKKWYKQPFQKFGHRRNDSTDETKNFIFEKHKTVQFDAERKPITPPKSLDDKFRLMENTASPRQRNRIRTNPWLSSNSNFPPTQPMTTQNFINFQTNFSPILQRSNKSCTNTPLQTRKINTDVYYDINTELRNRIDQMSIRYENSKKKLHHLEQAVQKHSMFFEHLSDHSEDDLTLNEMMGTYNESYVYEKETDILSDSDPTDCEDYATDSDADNGGDERDSHDELDYIDNSSLILENEELKNTGRCTYHDYRKSSFLRKNHSKRSRKYKDEKRVRKPLREKNEPEEKKKNFEIDENVGGLNLSRVLMKRMMTKNNVSKSAEGTPVCLRRRKIVKELRETHIGERKEEETKDSFISEKDLFITELEVDKKYNELITEAEQLINMKSPTVKKKCSNPRLELLSNEDRTPKNDTLKIWKNTEMLVTPMNLKTPTKSPKTLGLKLSTQDFKKKSSAHSPLDPLGPTFKNFTIFKEPEISSSSSEDSESIVSTNTKNVDVGTNATMVPLMFQSVDLGKPLNKYCPQSEPVKRKIYTCSKTYDRLVKRFEPRSKNSEESKVRIMENQGRMKNERIKEKNKVFYNPLYSPLRNERTVRRLSMPNNVYGVHQHFTRRVSFGNDTVR